MEGSFKNHPLGSSEIADVIALPGLSDFSVKMMRMFYIEEKAEVHVRDALLRHVKTFHAYGSWECPTMITSSRLQTAPRHGRLGIELI